MKIAFATQDQQRVDAHFGWAKHIAVYEIDADGYKFVQNFGFGEDLAEDGNEDKLGPKLDAIKDCAIVYVAAIGGSAAARVVASKIHPIKVSQPEVILDVLDNPALIAGYAAQDATNCNVPYNESQSMLLPGIVGEVDAAD